MARFSILDLAFASVGNTPADAFRNSLHLAQHAERWGYHRFWLAEHHNLIGIASAATAVVIGHVAAGTRTIRVGAGGIMLPNHAPLMVAEQFGTLESLFPGRIDLGLGRAPGTIQRTARALRRNPASSDSFPVTCWNCRRSSGRFRTVRQFKRCRAPVSRCRFGSSDRRCSALSLPPCLASRTRLRLISLRLR